MKIPILILISFVLLSSSVMAASLDRNIPSEVQPSSSFTVTYSTSGVPNGNWFVAWEEIVTGGCTPTSYKDFTSGTDATNQQKTKTFIAPSSGTCTFSGFYQFTEDSEKTFISKTTTISGTAPPSEPTGYCNLAEKIAFIGFMDNKCTEGSIIGGVIIFVILMLLIRKR